MAHEYILKSLVDGLENMAGDFEKFGVLLNLRAEVYGFPIRFKPTPYRAPKAPNYPSKEESLARAADFEGKIADNYGLVAAYFRIQSPAPAMLNADSYGEDGLLHVIASWQGLCAGVFKATLCYSLMARAMRGSFQSDSEPVRRKAPRAAARTPAGRVLGVEIVGRERCLAREDCRRFDSIFSQSEPFESE